MCAARKGSICHRDGLGRYNLLDPSTYERNQAWLDTHEITLPVSGRWYIHSQCSPSIPCDREPDQAVDFEEGLFVGFSLYKHYTHTIQTLYTLNTLYTLYTLYTRYTLYTIYTLYTLYPMTNSMTYYCSNIRFEFLHTLIHSYTHA